MLLALPLHLIASDESKRLRGNAQQISNVHQRLGKKALSIIYIPLNFEALEKIRARANGREAHLTQFLHTKNWQDIARDLILYFGTGNRERPSA